MIETVCTTDNEIKHLLILKCLILYNFCTKLCLVSNNFAQHFLMIYEIKYLLIITLKNFSKGF
jgi:hypothetical protein